MEQTKSISLFSFLQLAHQAWKLLVIAVILGGLIGLAISFLIQPEYEAVSVFSFSIDYARTGLLTDVEEDQAMEVAGDLISSTEVVQITRDKAVEMGLPVKDLVLKKQLFAERRFGQWLLKVRWNDPAAAAKLANIWSEAARSVLQNAREAAWQADSLHRYILSLETCFQQSTANLPAQPLCQISRQADLQAEITKSGQELQQRTEMSHGFFPGMNFSWEQEATAPESPVQYARGGLILAGCLAGFSAAAIAALFIHKI
ncbi:MAG: hypothetical protein GYA15_13370 [Leptolinea sp.]|nr:hypothetical protein [Leptolinea sp.]